MDISNPTHPLFGRLPPPIGPSNPNDPFFIPKRGHQMVPLETMDPNIPSTQLGAPIPQNNQPTNAQSLVHTTPQQPTITQPTSGTTSIAGVATTL